MLQADTAWKRFHHNWIIVRGICHRWMSLTMVSSLMLVWTSYWTNSRCSPYVTAICTSLILSFHDFLYVRLHHIIFAFVLLCSLFLFIFPFPHPIILCYSYHRIYDLGSNLNNGLHSIEIDAASNLFNLYEIDDLQWRQYNFYHASWNQA